MSIGAAFAALNIDVDLFPDIQPIDWNNTLLLKKDNSKSKDKIKKKPNRAERKKLKEQYS